MAFRIFQFGIVFTIILLINSVKVISTGLGGTGAVPLTLTLTNPSDVTLTRSSRSQVLRCRLNNSEPGGHTLQWLGPHGPVANDSQLTVMEDGSLVFKRPPKKSYEGEYRCLVENRVGKLLSSPARVHIAALSRSFNEQPTDITIDLGQPVHFPCHIQSTPNAKVHWQKDGEPLTTNTRYVPLSNGDLYISTVKSSDEGSYRCVATNELIKNKNTRKSSEGRLTVISAQHNQRSPKFLHLHKNYNFTAKIGENLQLYCAAEGWPIPAITWTNSANVPLGNSSVLFLRNLTKDHDSTYICTASNSLGRISQNYNVEIVQAPYFNKTPASQWFLSPRTVRLECHADGIPTPEITWLKNGEPLVLAGRLKKVGAFLVFSHTFTIDSGLYQCLATNKIGQVWAAAQLVANFSENRPTPPRNVRCRPYDNTSVCLQWDPPLNVDVAAYSIHGFGGSIPNEYITNNTYYLADRLDSNTNYSFYIRVYSKLASDSSENIACPTVVPATRTMSFKAISSSVLRIEWTSLSSDVPCGGSAEYKLQWRRLGHPSNNAEIVRNNFSIIRGLIPQQSYEMRVQTLNIDENITWEIYTMPDENSTNLLPSAVNESELKPKHSNKSILSPVQLEALPLSPKGIVLTWKDQRLPEDKLAGFYMICYAEVKAQQNCENGSNYIKSTTTKVEIKGLKPFTLYEFRVRTHNLDGSYGQFSLAIECKTPEDVPSPVTDLKWKTGTSKSVCLKWREPNHLNGQLKHYAISYTADRTLPLEEWQKLILPSQKINSHGCWGFSYDTISIFLEPLESGKEYFVVVRASNNAGLSKPTDLLRVYTSANDVSLDTFPPSSDNYDGLQADQKLGIAVGTIIALFCIIGCISCMIFRRRCIKSPGLDRIRAANPQTTNGQSVHQTQAISTVPSIPTEQQVTLDRQCTDTEVHELQCLVNRDIVTSHIPPLSQSNLDSKGGVLYPNGQINGLKYIPLSNGNIPNGNVHITENPQYEPYECNGHFTSASESHQLLSADAERSGNSDDTLNSTQLTSLDDTLTLSTHRTVSPILGPNG